MKKTLVLSALTLLFVAYPVSATELHRFYSEKYKGHFYTESLSEKEAVSLNNDWVYEGVAYPVSQEGDSIKVHRFWSDNFKHHFFTTSETEKERLEKNDPNWLYEGESFSVREEGNPVYRFWSDNFKGHFYTASETEKERLENNDPNWEYEGVAWHVGDDNSVTVQNTNINENNNSNTQNNNQENNNDQNVVVNVTVENIIENGYQSGGELECPADSDTDGDGWSYNGIGGCWVGLPDQEEAFNENITCTDFDSEFLFYVDDNGNGRVDSWENQRLGSHTNNFGGAMYVVREGSSELLRSAFSLVPGNYQISTVGNGSTSDIKFRLNNRCEVEYTHGKEFAYGPGRNYVPAYDPNNPPRCNVTPQFRIYNDYNMNGRYDSGEPLDTGSISDIPAGGSTAIYIYTDGTGSYADPSVNFSKDVIPGSYEIRHLSTGGSYVETKRFDVNSLCQIEHYPQNYLAYRTGRTNYPIPISCSVTPEFRQYEDLNANKQYDEGEPYTITNRYTAGDAYWTYRKGESPNENITSNIFDKGSYEAYGHVAGGGSTKAIEFVVDQYCEITYPLGSDVWYYQGRTSYPRSL